MSRKKRNILIIVFTLTIGAVFYGFVRNDFEIVKNIDIYASILKQLDEQYVDEINVNDLLKTSVDAMLSNLDPYTVFYQESDLEEFKLMTTGQYGGIGAFIQQDSDYVIISEPYDGWPAFEAGLNPGDKILEIEGYNKPINFQIWDTVGQEQYRSLNSLFFKDAQICLMVFDITRDETFESIKDYWYDAIQQNGLEGVIIGIAGNKNDLYAYEKVNRKEVRLFSEEIKSIFKFTSAKQNFCIKELFTELGKRFVSSKFMSEFGPEYFNDPNNRAKSFQLNAQEKGINKNKKKCC